MEEEEEEEKRQEVSGRKFRGREEEKKLTSIRPHHQKLQLSRLRVNSFRTDA